MKTLLEKKWKQKHVQCARSKYENENTTFGC